MFTFDFQFKDDIKTNEYQMTKIESNEVVVININRSSNAGKDFIEKLKPFIDFEKTTIVCGDFNFCSANQANHQISNFFRNLNFMQIVSDTTHTEGRSIDNIYLYQKDDPLTHSCRIFGCYYSDHDKVTLYLNTKNKL